MPYIYKRLFHITVKIYFRYLISYHKTINVAYACQLREPYQQTIQAAWTGLCSLVWLYLKRYQAKMFYRESEKSDFLATIINAFLTKLCRSRNGLPCPATMLGAPRNNLALSPLFPWKKKQRKVHHVSFYFYVETKHSNFHCMLYLIYIFGIIYFKFMK